eukprot:scaffold3785_cov165-Amphora_coffeaeformis.AAC.4
MKVVGVAGTDNNSRIHLHTMNYQIHHLFRALGLRACFILLQRVCFITKGALPRVLGCLKSSPSAFHQEWRHCGSGRDPPKEDMSGRRLVGPAFLPRVAKKLFVSVNGARHPPTSMVQHRPIFGLDKCQNPDGQGLLAKHSIHRLLTEFTCWLGAKMSLLGGGEPISGHELDNSVVLAIKCTPQVGSGGVSFLPLQ